MRLAFMGTPEFAVPSLAELIASGHEIVAVYSQPPRPKGRGQKLTPSPVQAFAEAMGLAVFTPASMKSPDAIEMFQSLDLDAACVVAYGQILKREVLDAPRLGCFNLHGSLLPRWRGAAPIQRAIMAGDRQTGVQIMRHVRRSGRRADPAVRSPADRRRRHRRHPVRPYGHHRRDPVDAGPGRHRTRRGDRDRTGR